MKMFYGNVPIKSLNVKHYEISTNDCDMIASDLQAGKTAVAKGRKITGTGKCFEFANYGRMKTNLNTYVPTGINIVEIASTEYPVKSIFGLNDMKEIDFTNPQNVATINIDGVDYDISVVANSNFLKISCDKTIYLQVFYGKDNYI